MNPIHLKTFLGVQKRLNFTHAARELFLSQPAVSRQVRQLEQELGVKLFEQIGKSLFLTDAGRTLAKEAEKLLGSFDRAAEAVKAHRDAERGTLRLGASTTPGLYLLPKVLGEFQERHPAIEISYTIESSLSIEEAILRNHLDVAFVGAHLSSRELRMDSMVEDEIVFFSSPDHRIARKNRLELKSLEEETWVIREKGSATRALVEGRLASAGVKIGKAITLGCPEAVKAVVAGGLGFSFLSVHGLKDDFQRGRLKKLKIAGFLLKRPLFCVRHLEKHTSPVMEAFIQTVQSAF